MNIPMINSANSVTTSSKRKREAERSVNWSVEETQVLLCAWSDQRVQKSLSENVRNKHVFKHLSARMNALGFSRSPHQCRLRVKTLKANYARAKLLKSVDGTHQSSFRYYAEMDAVLGKPPMNEPRLCLNFDVKSEDDHDASTDDLEFSSTAFSQPLPDVGPEASLETPVDSVLTAEPVEETSFKSASHSPQPSSPQLPDNTTSNSLETVLKYLTNCFQRLVSESRQLMVQLESQRLEQMRWQQELLGRWLELEDRRQREAAEREARRERARMEHELRVLQLLSGLQQAVSCPCVRATPGAAACRETGTCRSPDQGQEKA